MISQALAVPVELFAAWLRRLRSHRWASRVFDWLRAHRRIVSLLSLALAVVASYALALWIDAEFTDPGLPASTFLIGVTILAALRVGAASWVGLATHRWRWVGVRDVRRLVVAVVGGSIVLVAALVALGTLTSVDLASAFPPAVLVLEPLITLVTSAGLWLAYRTAYEIAKRSEVFGLGFRRVLVVGAGEAGEALVRQMLLHPGSYRPVALADDDWSRQGTSVHGIKVMGGTADLEWITQRSGAEEIIIAIPSAGPTALRQIVSVCQSTGLPFRVLPHIAEVMEGEISASQLREVRIEDLLGREPISLELPELHEELVGKTVLITGAAGSIGSELARQVAINQPHSLVLLDQSETGLFFLELEIRDLAPSIEVTCVVADVVDPGAVERVFRSYEPDWVLHAAAYKHVPMMETNEREALRNNVVGTWRIADAAGRNGADRFVLISTDKAVRPANVMGASKRLAEILVLELQDGFPDTAFGAVRFGNVLGSAGSVVPVFKKQLEEGKPLTVTHEDVTRYFMTIPEASQLVLQASLLPELRGRIAMLEMGEPVRILDLARSLIRLSGGGHGRDRIVVTGLRPGEKLHEELVAPQERVFPTRISKVNILEPGPSALQHGLLERIGVWDHLLAVWNVMPVVGELQEMVPELNRRWSESVQGDPDRPVEPEEAPSLGTLRNRRRPSDQLFPGYPYGAPGFLDRRLPVNRVADLSETPSRRATDRPDSGDAWGAARHDGG